MTSILLTAALAASSWVSGSTAYCLEGTMADGSRTRWGSAASNTLRLGTRIRVRPAPFGQREWIIRDRIGYGTPLDFWHSSCSAARAYGRRTVRVTVVR